MTYDLEKLSWRVAQRKRRFFTTLAVYAFVAAIGGVMLFADNKTVVFLGVIIVIFALAALIGHVSRSGVAYLFSGECRGINVKEHEYVANAPRGLSPSRAFMLRAKTYSRSGNPGPRTARVRQAYVYLRLPDGNVIILDGLSSLHTDIYEIGDELLRPSGARYPIVLNRELDRQPCPLCGRINGRDNMECASCGLDIIRR
jgi:hypothetical protein